MNVKQLYRWIEDQVADFDQGIAWNTLVALGKTVVGVDTSRLECAIGDLLNARRIVKNRDGRLIVR